MNKFQKIALTATGLLSVGAANAAAVDYSPLASAVDVSTVAAALVAMGAVVLGPNVAKWAVAKIGSFFGR